jgi:hypothetical protein
LRWLTILVTARWDGRSENYHGYTTEGYNLQHPIVVFEVAVVVSCLELVQHLSAMNFGPTYLNNFDGVQHLAFIVVSKREELPRQMLTEFAQVPTSKALDERSKAVFRNFNEKELYPRIMSELKDIVKGREETGCETKVLMVSILISSRHGRGVQTEIPGIKPYWELLVWKILFITHKVTAF